MDGFSISAVQTARLSLVPFTQEHAGDVERFARLWEVARYTANIPHPYPPGCAREFARDAEHDRRAGTGGLVFAIEFKGKANVVGLIELMLDDDRRWAELGYALSPDFWGRGIATEAARAVVAWGFGTLGIDTIVSRALVINPASCRVLQKAGFRRIGHGSYDMPQRGGDGLFEDYRLLRREWSA